nr:hypothetical protein [Nocardia seriolae]
MQIALAQHLAGRQVARGDQDLGAPGGGIGAQRQQGRQHEQRDRPGPAQ